MMKLKFALSMIFLMSLSACFETTTPLCDSESKEDVPNLSQTFNAYFTPDPSKEIQKTAIRIDRTEKGEYTVTNLADQKTVQLQTCRFGKWYLFESKTPNEFGTYTQNVVQYNADFKTLNQLWLGTDQKALKESNIPFEVVKRKIKHNMTQILAPFPNGVLDGSEEMEDDVLVINTSSPESRAALKSIFKLMAVSISLQVE